MGQIFMVYILIAMLLLNVGEKQDNTGKYYNYKKKYQCGIDTAVCIDIWSSHMKSTHQ